MSGLQLQESPKPSHQTISEFCLEAQCFWSILCTCTCFFNYWSALVFHVYVSNTHLSLLNELRTAQASTWCSQHSSSVTLHCNDLKCEYTPTSSQASFVFRGHFFHKSNGSLDKDADIMCVDASGRSLSGMLQGPLSLAVTDLSCSKIVAWKRGMAHKVYRPENTWAHRLFWEPCWGLT